MSKTSKQRSASPLAALRRTKPSSPAIMDMLSQAIDLHQHEEYERAEVLYQTILDVEPRNFDALHMLGVLKGIRQDDEEAARNAA